MIMLGFCNILIMIGLILACFDIFVPLRLPIILVLSLRIIGMILCFVGIILLDVRVTQSMVGSLIDPVSAGRVKLIHQRRGKHPNVKILNGKLMDLEHIKTKNKIFKDTGGGFRWAGHDIRRTHETVFHELPEWLGQYFYQIKNKYMVSDLKSLSSLYNRLRNLQHPDECMKTIRQQLEEIPELREVMKDSKKRGDLLSMSLKELKNMSELLYDGQIIHMEEVESFLEGTTPNELDSFMTQNTAHKFLQFRNYTEPNNIDWARWAPVMAMLFLSAAIAISIITKG